MQGERLKEFMTFIEEFNLICGRKIEDEVILDDLFYWNASLKLRGNPPQIWVDTLNSLSVIERTNISRLIGPANRALSDELNKDATVGDLRATPIERMKNWSKDAWRRSDRKLADNQVEAIFKMFKLEN